MNKLMNADILCLEMPHGVQHKITFLFQCPLQPSKHFAHIAVFMMSVFDISVFAEGDVTVNQHKNVSRNGIL